MRRYDPRFGYFVVTFEVGPIRGELRAFSRPPPRLQIPTAELLASVQQGCLAGRRHWVIGGSRRLGELSAKAVTAAGGDVLLTYFQGADDAAVVADISAAGAGSAEAVQLPLPQDFNIWMSGRPMPDVVWYFATPRIFHKCAQRFSSASAFAELLEVYVVRFVALCESLQRHVGGNDLTIVMPSTVFIDARPADVTEYAIAKPLPKCSVRTWQRHCLHCGS